MDGEAIGAWTVFAAEEIEADARPTDALRASVSASLESVLSSRDS